MPPLEADYDESINNSTDSVDDHRWSKIFPKCVADSNMSAAFMKRAIYVAFSVILHRRKILPDEFFSKNYITSKMSCFLLCFKNVKSHAISQWLKACGDAVQKKHLKELCLVVTKKEGEVEAVETYSLKFHYYEDGRVAASLGTRYNEEPSTPFEKLTELEYKGTSSVRDQLVLLVRSIIYITQKVLKPLPPDFAVNFRIEYAEGTPDDFKVDGFADSSKFYTLPEDIQSATLGHLRPGHHGAFMDCSSKYMEDAYKAESDLKRHLDGIASALGYDSNESIYQTMETLNVSKDSKQNVTPEKTKEVESLEAVPMKPGESPIVAPRKTRVSGRSKGITQKSRQSPYSKTRSRK
ncbi:unnamed protein product [Caenorhabditis nigoni]